jgi:Pentapeptide repeats (8 copies)
MRTRPGFARLLPLMALAGLAAGTLALLSSARPVQVPAPELLRAVGPGRYFTRAGCMQGLPVPRSGFCDAHGRRWTLEDLRPGALLVGADLRGIQWSGADLHGVRFKWCDLRGARLEGCDLVGVEMSDCRLDGADLARANLSRSKLSACGLRGVNLSQAVLRDIQMCVSDLAGADFATADLSEWPGLIECLYSKQTRWPAGFEPRAHGAGLVP